MKKILLSLLLLISPVFAAQQQGMKIHDYPSTTTVGDDDLFLIDFWSGTRYSTNKNISFTNLVTELQNLITVGAQTRIRNKVFNIMDYGATTNSADNRTALVNTLAAAAGEGGGTIYVPPFNNPFNLSQITIAQNNIKFAGGGSFKATTPTNIWVSITGSNIQWTDVGLNGNNLVATLLEIGANGGTDLVIRDGFEFQNALCYDSNNTALQGAAQGILVRRGNTRIRIFNGSIHDITYQGQGGIGGCVRTCAGIYFTPSGMSSSADNFKDIEVGSVRFYNIGGVAGGEKVDADAIRAQAFLMNDDINIRIHDNEFRSCGERGVKMICGGYNIANNNIVSTSTVDVGGTTATAAAMTAGIAVFGSSGVVANNKITGSYIYEGIKAAASDTLSTRAGNIAISGNEINFTGYTNAHGIFIGSLTNVTVSGNTINNTRHGVRVQGQAAGISVSGLTVGLVQFYDVYATAESTGVWAGMSPTNMVINGVTSGSAFDGVFLDTGCRNVNVGNIQGTFASTPIFRSSGVTGDDYLTDGAPNTLVSYSAFGSSVTAKLRANTATPKMELLGPSDNRILSWDGTGNTLTFGDNGSQMTLRGNNIFHTTNVLPTITTSFDLGSSSFQWNKVYAPNSTGVGITNISGVYSANVAAGANITLTTNSGGQLFIASSAGGTGIAGTMISDVTGFSTGAVPKAKDSTGTNFTGSGVIITSTNVSIPGTLTVDNIVATNGIVIGGGSTNLNITGNITANGGNFTNSLQLNGVGVVTTARTLTAGTGLSGGGDLSADRTFNITTNSTQQKVWVAVGTTNLGVFDRITLWPGSNVSITTTNGTGNTNVDVSIASTGSGGGFGGVIKFGGTDTSSNPSSGGFTLYSGGTVFSVPSTTFDNQKIYVPANGTIKKLFVRVRVAGTLGTTENVLHQISINGAAGTGTGVTLTYSAVNNIGSSTESIAVSAGDYIALVFTTPTWSTPPTTVYWESWAYIE